MASFTWIGGPLGNPLSYSPQPDPPTPPVLPGPDDTVTFPGGGLLVGGVSLRFADFTTGGFDLVGSVTARSGMTFANVSSLTVEADAQLAGPSLQFQGTQVSQYGGTVSDSGALGSSFLLDSGARYSLNDGSLSVGGSELIGYHVKGTFVQSGGSNTMGGGLLLFNDASYLLQSGTLTVNCGPYNEFIGGGEFQQEGGTHVVKGDFAIGISNGTRYVLTGGDLSAPKQFIGEWAESSFTQSGGTNTAGDRIVLGISVFGPPGAIGKGTYVLGGTGHLTVQTIYIGSDPNCTGIFDFNTRQVDAATITILGTGGVPGLIVGGEGIGTFTQGRGETEASVVVGRWSTSIGTLNLDGGSFRATEETIGKDGTGTFNHRGDKTTIHTVEADLMIGKASTAVGTYNFEGDGTVTVEGTVTLGVDAGAQGGFNFTSDGAFDIEKGAVGAGAGLLIVGASGVGKFTQERGRASVAGDTVIGKQTGSAGSYELSGEGHLRVIGNLTLGAEAGSSGLFDWSPDHGGIGTLEIQGPAGLTVGDAGIGAFRQNGGELTTHLTIAAQADSNGTYSLDDGLLTASGAAGGPVFIAKAGTGRFNQSGGQANFISSVIVGSIAGSTGIVEVGRSGNATEMQFSGMESSLIVGDLGKGSLNQNLGAKLSVADGYVVGGQAGGSGSVEQRGGSQTTVAGVLAIGGLGGGVGKYHVDDSDTKLQIGGLLIGASEKGSGQFTLTAGQVVQSASSAAVVGQGGSGLYKETGGVATFTGGLTVGAQAKGDGTITLGGTGKMIVKAPIEIARDAGSKGSFDFNSGSGDEAVLEGLGSNGASFRVGTGGTGTLEIGGGVLVVDDIAIGGRDLSSGTVEVNGKNTTVSALKVEVGNVDLLDLKGTFKGGTGALFVRDGAAMSVKGTLTLHDAAIVNDNGRPVFNAEDGRIYIDGGGSLNVGGLGRAPADTLHIGVGGRLSGHGLIDSTIVGKAYVQPYEHQTVSPAQANKYALTVDIDAGTDIEAIFGPLTIHGNITGGGTALISDHSTLEIEGSVGKTVTVKFADADFTHGSATLILDRPNDFKGTLSNIAVGDRIVLRQTNHENWNEVLSATIGKDGNHVQQLLISEGFFSESPGGCYGKRSQPDANRHRRCAGSHSFLFHRHAKPGQVRHHSHPDRG